MEQWVLEDSTPKGVEYIFYYKVSKINTFGIRGLSFMRTQRKSRIASILLSPFRKFGKRFRTIYEEQKILSHSSLPKRQMDAPRGSNGFRF